MKVFSFALSSQTDGTGMEHLETDWTGTRQEKRGNFVLRGCRLKKPREISPSRTVFLYKLFIKYLHLDKVSVFLLKENSQLYWKYLDLQNFEDNNCRSPISYYCGYCNPEAKPSQLKKNCGGWCSWVRSPKCCDTTTTTIAQFWKNWSTHPKKEV